MPIIKFVDSNNKEVDNKEFKATGKPLPRNITWKEKVYTYESKVGTTYTYKEVIDL